MDHSGTETDQEGNRKAKYQTIYKHTANKLSGCKQFSEQNKKIRFDK